MFWEKTLGILPLSDKSKFWPLRELAIRGGSITKSLHTNRFGQYCCIIVYENWGASPYLRGVMEMFPEPFHVLRTF